MIFNDDLTYDKERVDNFDELHQESKKIFEWLDLEGGEDILEIACHTGVLSEWLQKKGAKVTGVDMNSTALERAKPYLQYSILADIEKDEFWNQLDGKKFNAILCIHVLEHLIDPWKFLHKMKTHLSPNGNLIIALPNITNAKDRFHILFGKFEYSRDGVMDQTHLRFFNRNSAEQLIDQAGLHCIDYFSPYQINPIHYFLDHLPFFHRLKGIFKKDKVPFCYRRNTNLTDVVLMFKCRLEG